MTALASDSLVFASATILSTESGVQRFASLWTDSQDSRDGNALSKRKTRQRVDSLAHLLSGPFQTCSPRDRARRRLRGPPTREQKNGGTHPPALFQPGAELQMSFCPCVSRTTFLFCRKTTAAICTVDTSPAL